MITLILTRGGDSRPLHLEQDLITVGRSKENVVPINDRKVSRKHAKIERVGAAFQITDLGSGNGTRVNGTKVDFQALNEGDEIKIGDAILLVRAIDAEEQAAAPAAEPAADVASAETPVGIDLSSQAPEPEVDLLPEPAPVKDPSQEVTDIQVRSPQPEEKPRAAASRTGPAKGIAARGAARGKGARAT